MCSAGDEKIGVGSEEGHSKNIKEAFEQQMSRKQQRPDSRTTQHRRVRGPEGSGSANSVRGNCDRHIDSADYQDRV